MMNNQKKLLTFALSMMVSTNALAVVEGENGIETCAKGRYKHTYIKADSPIFDKEQKEVLPTLKNFIEKCKQLEPENAVYFQLPYNKGALMSLVQQVGFRYDCELYITPEKSNERKAVGQQWIIRNNSLVPAKPSFTHTSRIGVVDKKGNVLLIQPKKGRKKTFPGGTADFAEDPINTGIREVLEEVKVQLSKESIIPLAVLHRKPLEDSQGFKAAGDTSFYYASVISNKDELTLIPQKNEIYWAGWMHWSDLIKGSEVGNHIKLVVEKIFKGSENDKSCVHELPDFHTFYKNEKIKQAAALKWKPTMSVTISKMGPLVQLSK